MSSHRTSHGDEPSQYITTCHLYHCLPRAFIPAAIVSFLVLTKPATSPGYLTNEGIHNIWWRLTNVERHKYYMIYDHVMQTIFRTPFMIAFSLLPFLLVLLVLLTSFFVCLIFLKGTFPDDSYLSCPERISFILGKLFYITQEEKCHSIMHKMFHQV